MSALAFPETDQLERCDTILLSFSSSLLSHCKEPAKFTCEVCGKNVCALHAAPPGLRMCGACYALDQAEEWEQP